VHLDPNRSSLTCFDGFQALSGTYSPDSASRGTEQVKLHIANRVNDRAHVTICDTNRHSHYPIHRFAGMGFRAYQATDVKTAQRLLLDLARRPEHEYPSAAERVREGLDETLTVLTLQLSPRLRRSLATTNAAESLISRTRLVKRNVKRWRGGQMMLRWVAAGILEAVKGFRRLKGSADMPTLVNALRARDRQLGLFKAEEDRQVA
jgi:hypothetical protein